MIALDTNMLVRIKDGDFADLLIVNQAMEQQAKTLFSFDKKLQKRFPGYVVGKPA